MSKSNVKIKVNNAALQQTIANAISKSSFNITCPNCETTFSVHGSQFGNNVICPNCNMNIFLNDDKLKQSINNIKL